MKKEIDFKKAIGQHTLLYGEINTGKTYYTAQFIDYLLKSEYISPADISVLDFAPALNINNIKFGGKIKDFSKMSLKCKYLPLEGEIIPPRFNARDRKELFENVCHNYKIATKSLQLFNENPTNFLIINDLSIYLHLGNKNYLLQTIINVNTFFGNSYYGTKIKSSFSKLLSLKERKRVEFLINHIQNSILTSK
ncbi:MAG: hypothetical protein KGD66_04920 [Candidatus Lokiarchaeota archaeon]|nr:hypothetical protein [Candidatus Lokiarchaeota archaeon]